MYAHSSKKNSLSAVVCRRTDTQDFLPMFPTNETSDLTSKKSIFRGEQKGSHFVPTRCHCPLSSFACLEYRIIIMPSGKPSLNLF